MITLGNGWVNDAAGAKVPILSGEFHYFRNERQYWPRILRNMKDAGLTVAASFVQPNYHEHEPGRFDFDGKTAPERDLPHLLKLAKEIGIYVCLRLGPACCEWRESGGTSFGTDWHTISDAFWDAVGPYQADLGGSLLLYQVHNEWVHPLGIYYIMLPAISGFDGFTAPPVPHWLELVGPNAHFLAAGYQFSMDYFPRYLASLYPDVSAMNKAWDAAYPSFEAVKDELVAAGVNSMHEYITYCRGAFGGFAYPAQSPRRVPDMLNWANLFKAAQLADEADYTRRRTNLPVLHNWAMGDERRWSAMTHMDLCGYDMYAPTGVDIWQWNKNTCDMQTSPFPLSNEFMCGTIERYEWGGQGFYTDNFARMSILSYIMGGMKGVNLYMFVERDNWLQCPLDERGGKRSVYGVISSIIKALKRNKWHEMRMVRDLGVFKNTDYHRYADGSDDGMFDEGYREPYVRDGLYKGHSPKQQFVAAFRALHNAHVDFEVFKDTRGGDSIRDFKAILAYSLWFTDRSSARDLLAFVENGRALVMFPCVPTHTDDGRELDVFTGRLGLEPFAADQTADSHVPIGEIDIDAVLRTASGDFRTSDGRLWAQARSYGRGKVLALNVQLADCPEALEKAVTSWAGCRKYVDTRLDLTDGGMAVHSSSYALAAVVNGTTDQIVREAAVDVSRLAEADVYAVTDELSDSLIGSLEPSGGIVNVPLRLGPRDGTLLKIAPGPVELADKVQVKLQAVPLTDWRARREEESEYHRRYLESAIDDSWIRVPLSDWTLPAIASGRVYGVQGWFYLKQNLTLPDSDRPVYLHVRAHGHHNLGVVYLNGRECGRFAVERPGAGSFFDVTRLVNRGDGNTLAIRLYRQSLDCHDRGLSGFDLLRFECGAESVTLDHLYLKQERRDVGETAGWAEADYSDREWEHVDIPLQLEMNRAGDALWLRSDVDVKDPENAQLRLQGSNCVVGVFLNGEYVVKTPMLPCTLPTDGFLRQGPNTLALRIAPDNFENYLIPRGKRCESYIRDGFLPLDVRLERVELITGDQR